jgi:1-acyl-sn-glycerol-3-phosphate acyltransferase
MRPDFTNRNEYHTPPEKKRVSADRFFGNSRWYFTYSYILEVARARKLAVQGKYDTPAWVNSSVNILRHIENCGGKFHITGLDNIRQAPRPLVFISNHMSTLETFVFPCLIASIMEVTFVVKKSLTTHFLFGPVMRARSPIVVNRKDPREDLRVVLEEGKKKLREGISVIIFPQSTRSAVWNPASFNTLGIKLAKEAGVPVLPAAIKTDFWGNGKYLKDIGPVNRHLPVHMVFGKAMNVSGNGKEEHQRIVQFIGEHVRKWQ